MSTKILNQTYPLGNVTVNFSDGTVTQTVNTIGDTEFDSGSRVLVSVELFGNTYEKPGSYQIQYPNGTWGECSFNDIVQHEYIIYVN